MSDTRISSFQIIDKKLTFKENDIFYYYSLKHKKFTTDKTISTDFNYFDLESAYKLSSFLYNLNFPYFYSDEYSIVYDKDKIYSFEERKFLNHTYITFVPANLYYRGIKTYYNETKLDCLLNYLYQHFNTTWDIPVDRTTIVDYLLGRFYDFEDIWEMLDYLNERLDDIGRITKTEGNFLFLDNLGRFLTKGGDRYHVFALDGIKQEEIKFYNLESMLEVLNKTYNLNKYFQCP